MNNQQAICVCGAGTMGSGIAQVFAVNGYPVILYDVNAQVLSRSHSAIESGLQLLADKQKISVAEKMAAVERINFTSVISNCRAHLVIEAVIEDEDTKVELANRLFAINDDSCIVVTNTSSLSVTSVAARVSAPERFAGMHFFNPAPVMRLVEIVKTNYTADEVITQLVSISRSIGKTPVLCKDAPGFIVNRVARPYYLESLHLLEISAATIQQIDTLMEATGFRMGPFRLMDLIGNDINRSVSAIIYEALNKPERLKPSALQETMVREGKLGRKSGKGFYEYTR